MPATPATTQVTVNAISGSITQSVMVTFHCAVAKSFHLT
jgi:hypothetical protein